jgi:signal peptidase II
VKRLFLILGIVLIDSVTKWLVHGHLLPLGLSASFFPFSGLSIFENFFGIDFCIHHVTNRGAAWGVGANWQHLLLILRLSVVAGLVTYLFASPKAYRIRYSLALVIAGGVGNILDYFLYGHVVDMFHFFFWGYSYPVFNIADASIFCGIAGLLLGSLKQRKGTSIETKGSSIFGIILAYFR